MFILGGADQENNYSCRSLYFNKYLKFYEKPPMICRRAFFPGIFCIIDSCIYVFGGQDGTDDLKMCEKFSVSENVWRPISPMNEARNGSSCVIMDKAIFIFGGNSQHKKSLDSIERYSIEYDCWESMKLKLKCPI
jgi:hypothetical protein